jgi:hypothetical protein
MAFLDQVLYYSDYISGTASHEIPTLTAGKIACIIGFADAGATEPSATVGGAAMTLASFANYTSRFSIYTFYKVVGAGGTDVAVELTISQSNPRWFVLVLDAADFLAAATSATPDTDSPTDIGLATFDTGERGALTLALFVSWNGVQATLSDSNSNTYTELYDPPGESVCLGGALDAGSEDPTTSITITATYGAAPSFNLGVAIAFQLPLATATGFSATARQTAVNTGQKGFFDVGPSPADAAFAASTIITATAANGSVHFIRSDGVHSDSTVTLSGSQTAVGEYWTTSATTPQTISFDDDQGLTDPSDLSFTVVEVESSYPTATVDAGYDGTAGSGFGTPPTASGTPHGSGFTGRAIGTFHRALGEYMASTSERVVSAFFHTPDPSGMESAEFYVENDTPTVAQGYKLRQSGKDWWGFGVQLPDVDGVYTIYAKGKPFNGLEVLLTTTVVYNGNGTLPVSTASASTGAELVTALSGNPSDELYIITLTANIEIPMDGDGTTVLTAGNTSIYPIIIKSDGTRRTIGGETGTFDNLQVPHVVPSIILQNVHLEHQYIHQLYINGAGTTLVLDASKETTTLGEFSRWSDQQHNDTVCGWGVSRINGCRVYSTQPSYNTFFRGGDNDLRDLTPNMVVMFDSFATGGGTMINGLAVRFSAMDPTLDYPIAMPYGLIVTGSTYNSGTNLSAITVSNMPQGEAYEILAYTDRVAFRSDTTTVALQSATFPAVIGSTNVAAGSIVVAGDASAAVPGDIIDLRAVYQQRLHYDNTLTVVSKSYDGGTDKTTITYTAPPSGDASGQVEFLRFATATTTTALKGMEFAVGVGNYDHTAHTVSATGNINCSAGDTFWLLQEAHGDSLQIGHQTNVFVGPIVVQNYLAIGFQPMLVQPGAGGTASGIALVNMLAVAYTGTTAQVQQRLYNFIAEECSWLQGNLSMRNNVALDLDDVSFRNNIIVGTQSDVGWPSGSTLTLTNNHFIDGSDEGTHATTGALTFSSAYLSEDAAVEDRVWHSMVPYDIFGNARGTLSRLGAVDAAPTPEGGGGSPVTVSAVGGNIPAWLVLGII